MSLIRPGMKAVLAGGIFIAAAQLAHAAVHALEMPVVRAKLFGGNLPVAANDRAMRSGRNLRSGTAAIQQQVQVPLHFSEVFLERNDFRGERAKNEISVRGNASGFP